MSENNTLEKEFALEKVVTSAVQIPGVKVNRNKFLAEIFATEDLAIQDVLDLGPIKANVSQKRLDAIAKTLILKRTSQSSIASFLAGIPGGLAMAATIPADLLQFFGMALRLAQELAYLYGEQDLWEVGAVSEERVKNQLILYCGVMFGASGAVSGVRVLSAQLAKATLKNLPQKALTKTFWYPIVKQIGKAIGVKITKTTVAQGVSKAVPLIGGVTSGGINFFVMKSMANRLQSAFDSAMFGYTEEDLEKDLIEIENLSVEESDSPTEKTDIKTVVIKGGQKAKNSIVGYLSKNKSDAAESQTEDVFETIKKLSEVKEKGLITQEEFNAKKAELLARI